MTLLNVFRLGRRVVFCSTRWLIYNLDQWSDKTESRLSYNCGCKFSCLDAFRSD